MAINTHWRWSKMIIIYCWKEKDEEREIIRCWWFSIVYSATAIELFKQYQKV